MNRLPLLILFALALPACAPDRPADALAHPPETPAVDVNAPLSEASLYILDASWTDQDGQPTTLAAFRGRPVVLAMVFTSCAFACPMIVQDMKEVAEALPEARGVQYVLVSMDPERDTPEALRAFRDAHRLGPEWTLLRGSADDVRMLAALLNVRYRQEADGQFAHSNVFTVLDVEGEIVRQQEGIGTDPAVTVAALDGAARRP